VANTAPPLIWRVTFVACCVSHWSCTLELVAKHCTGDGGPVKETMRGRGAGGAVGGLVVTGGRVVVVVDVVVDVLVVVVALVVVVVAGGLL
jgi:hypothetical protein